MADASETPRRGLTARGYDRSRTPLPPGSFKEGYDPRRGPGGGKKGRSGRKPDAWKEMMRKLVNRTSTLRALKRVLKNPQHPAWAGALKFAAEQAYGKPTQEIAIEARLTLENLLTRSCESDRLEAAEPAEIAVVEAPAKTAALARGKEVPPEAVRVVLLPLPPHARRPSDYGDGQRWRPADGGR